MPLEFAELDDPIGRETLRRMASVDRYNRWIYDEIAPYAGRRLLEVGCGIGNMTSYFLGLDEVVGLDRLPSSVRYVRPHLPTAPMSISARATSPRVTPWPNWPAIALTP
ncbi:hypothetical protein [Candidatus Amarolinea dominans]|uniref:class I SAM-dependent methyltransferase n=1 Tax=Candidatus Amarolinea dominans TaxID=3140696 RepID=UPI00313644C7|nr:hypothetical protein [Anaerolineae bacterium]